MAFLTQAALTNAEPNELPDAHAQPRGGFVLAVRTLAWRELVRFFRQRGRVMGAVATPVLLWLAIGVGLDDAFVVGVPSSGDDGRSIGGVGYLEYFYPGMSLMMVLFTAIFSTISVIEDRKEGFLQAVLVSPASRGAIILGKVLGGSAVAVVQGVVLVALWPIVGGYPGVVGLLGAMGMVFVIAVGLTALGLCFAWRMDSAGAYHGVMSVVLMPMWLLCGAVFPLATAGALKWLMYANPLTYGYAAFAGLLHGSGGQTAGQRDALVGIPLWVAGPVAVVLAAAALMMAAAIASAQRTDGK